MVSIDSRVTKLLRDPQRRQAWVVFALKQNGKSIAAIARDNGVTRQTLYSALLRPYPRMEKILADALGATPQKLFPERYDSNGLPVSRADKSANKKNTTAGRSRNGESRRVA